MKHTSGPWRYQLKVLCKGVDDNGNKIDPYTIDHYYAIESGDGFWGDPNDPRGFDIQAFMKESDALLISSAPDLLEALEALRAAFVVAVGDKSPFAKVALTKVDEVISKAKGL